MTEQEHPSGSALINGAYVATGALLVLAVAAAITPDTFGLPLAVFSGGLFALGSGALLWAYALGVVRSGEETVTLAGLFFASSAPKIVRFRLRLVCGVQTVIAVAAASVRPYTAVAFAVLAPMFGLGLMALWGARHGTFDEREPRR